jgi:hypothetical protein
MHLHQRRFRQHDANLRAATEQSDDISGCLVILFGGPDMRVMKLIICRFCGSHGGGS